MHHAVGGRGEVDHPAYGAVRVYEPELAGGGERVVGGDVLVVGEGGGELGGGVDDVEGEGLVVVGAPGAGAGGVDDCFAGGGVVPR